MSVNQTASNQSESFWRKTILLSGGVTLLCCFGALCYFGLLFYVIDQDIALIPTPTLDPNCGETACLNACIRRLPDFEVPPLNENWFEHSEKITGVEIARYKWDKKADQLILLATPTVEEYLLPYQTESIHRQIWEYYANIFPDGSEVRVSYIVFSVNNFHDRFAAAVRDLGSEWYLLINLHDFHSSFAITNTLTHEYGHLLTLNKTQTILLPDEYGSKADREEFDNMRFRCNGRFFSANRCAIERSYLHDFGNRFWTGQLYDDWVTAFLQFDEEEIVYHAAIDEFYGKYPDQFVSLYAATNPHEDIAESWTEFILRQKPEGNSIAEQKVLFFYDYPELVQMRSDILQGICRFAMEQNSALENKALQAQQHTTKLTPP